jgi:hypothetical protein
MRVVKEGRTFQEQVDHSRWQSMRKSERDRKKGQLLERLPPGKWNFDDAGVGDKEDVINTPGKPSDRLMMMIVAWYKR